MSPGRMLDGTSQIRPATPSGVTSYAASRSSQSPQTKLFRERVIVRSWSNPKITWIPGDWMSRSTTAMFLPSAARSVATFALVFDLPVPPRNEWTETSWAMARPYPLQRSHAAKGPGEHVGLDRLRDVVVHPGREA